MQIHLLTNSRHMFLRLSLLSLFVTFLSTSHDAFAAVNFKKFSYEELKVYDTNDLDTKAKKKYEKAWKKATKKRQKIIAKAKKKHEKSEAKRIKKLSKSPEIWTHNQTQVVQSEFDPVPVANGPQSFLSGAFSVAMIGYGGTKFFMRSVGTDVFQIYLVDSYSGDWKSWNTARLSGGKEADFVSISRDVLNCNDGQCKCVEHFAVGFPKGFLNSWYEMGGGNIKMEVRGTTTGARKVLEIPETYIFGYIDKVNQTFDIVDPEIVAARRAELEDQLLPVPFVVTDELFN